jgi:hypothetical protein
MASRGYAAAFLGRDDVIIFLEGKVGPNLPQFLVAKSSGKYFMVPVLNHARLFTPKLTYFVPKANRWPGSRRSIAVCDK